MGESRVDTHLGGDDPVVWVPLGDVGLSARRGLPVAHVDRPAVHPVLLPGTLRVGNRAVSVGGAWGQGLPRVGFHAGLCGGQRGAAGPTCKVDPYSPPPPLPHPFRNLCFPPPHPQLFKEEPPAPPLGAAVSGNDAAGPFKHKQQQQSPKASKEKRQ